MLGYSKFAVKQLLGKVAQIFVLFSLQYIDKILLLGCDPGRVIL